MDEPRDPTAPRRWWPAAAGVSPRPVRGIVLVVVAALSAACAAPPSALPTAVGTTDGRVQGDDALAEHRDDVLAGVPAWARATLAGTPAGDGAQVEVSTVRVSAGAGAGATDGSAAGGADGGAALTGGEIVVVGVRAAADPADAGAGDAVDTEQVMREAQAAVATTRRAWTRPWSGRVLVVVPHDRSAWSAVAGRGDTANAPASTPQASITPKSTASGPTAPGSAAPESTAPESEAASGVVAPAMTVISAGGSAYVVLDPVARAEARAAGRQALLTHEVVHVAVAGDPDGPARSAPRWLDEGFAQLVAYDEIDARPSLVAAGLVERVRRGDVPHALPRDSDLAGGSVAREDAYAQAWTAARALRDLAGPSAPRRALEAGGLRAIGIDEATLTRAWQRDLRAFAAEPPAK